MGSATMDRLLRAEKAKGGNRRHAPRTKPGSLLRLIPIVSSRELSAAAPGQVEVDLVSHDGGKAAGDHCYTLTVTDRCSGWTQIVAVPSRAQVVVFAALTTVLTSLPFPVLVLHSDNGSEFINNELRRFCDAHGIRFTRSRPYHKNDNCYVESKNWTLVRRCLGYRRFDTKSQLADLQTVGDPPCSACQHPPAFHDPPREDPDREQDPEEVPCSLDSAPPTSASSRGQ